MDEERSAQVSPDRETWQELAYAENLEGRSPEEIVAAVRRLNQQEGASLQGKLLLHLRGRAERYLRPRVDRNLPDQGLGAVGGVLDKMVEDLLTPDAADAAGYEAAFFPKLRQRLTDQVRKLRSQQKRNDEPSQDEEGDTAEPSVPFDGLDPEEAAIVGSIIKALPERHRKALSLYRLGYRCSDADGGETIATVMGISTKTAEKLMREARAMVRKHLD